jgi:hypothetical protein
MINILLQVLEKNTKILEKEKILLKKKKMGWFLREQIKKNKNYNRKWWNIVSNKWNKN